MIQRAHLPVEVKCFNEWDADRGEQLDDERSEQDQRAQ